MRIAPMWCDPIGYDAMANEAFWTHCCTIVQFGLAWTYIKSYHITSYHVVKPFGICGMETIEMEALCFTRIT